MEKLQNVRDLEGYASKDILGNQAVMDGLW